MTLGVFLPGMILITRRGVFLVVLNVLIQYEWKLQMKIGDLIRHRNRISSDPSRTYSSRDAWGERGIVIDLCHAGWDRRGLEPAVKYMNSTGDIILAPERDMEVLS